MFKSNTHKLKGESFSWMLSAGFCRPQVLMRISVIICFKSSNYSTKASKIAFCVWVCCQTGVYGLRLCWYPLISDLNKTVWQAQMFWQSPMTDIILNKTQRLGKIWAVPYVNIGRDVNKCGYLNYSHLFSWWRLAGCKNCSHQRLLWKAIWEDAFPLQQ